MGANGNRAYRLVTTTDHKLIISCVACFGFFFVGGLTAVFMGAELSAPGLQFLSNEKFAMHGTLFTMYGTVMLLGPRGGQCAPKPK